MRYAPKMEYLTIMYALYLSKQEALQMQRDHAMLHKYKISHLKRCATANDFRGHSRSLKSRMVMLFWCWLTQVVLQKRPFKGCYRRILLRSEMDVMHGIVIYALVATLGHYSASN